MQIKDSWQLLITILFKKMAKEDNDKKYENKEEKRNTRKRTKTRKRWSRERGR